MKTSTQIGHRHIPCVEQSFDCVQCSKAPAPVLDSEDALAILKNNYATTSSDYRNLQTITRSYSAYRKSPHLTGIQYMSNFKDSLYNEPLSPPKKRVSTSHDAYQAKDRYPSLGFENCISFVEESCKPKALEEAVLPAGAQGITRFLDQYVSVNRLHHRAFEPYNPEKTITFYSDMLEKKAKKPPDPTKNMCLGKGRPNIKISYDRVNRRRPIPLKSDLTTTTKSAYGHPVAKTQKQVKDLMNVGIRWNDSKYLPFKCKLSQGPVQE